MCVKTNLKLLDITGYVPDARWCNFSNRTHDFLTLSKLMPWPSKSPDLNPIKRNWDVIGRVVWRRGLTNVRRCTCTTFSYGRMERNYTGHVKCLGYVCDIDAQLLQDSHRSK